MSDRFFSVSNTINIVFILQKYRCNAEPLAIHEEQNNETSERVFDELIKSQDNHEENDRGDAVAAAVAAVTAQSAQKPVKKKTVSNL